jgi:Domain of unknown function (DUF5671)
MPRLRAYRVSRDVEEEDMAIDSELTGFVKAALSRGSSREAISGALLRAGWEQPRVRAALDDFADDDFPIPVPRPRTNLSARDAFLYLLLFGTLYVSAFNLGSLVFFLIDRAFPDARRSAAAAAAASVAMRWAVSALIVAVPVFLQVSSIARREVRRDAARRGTDIRRALTYLTLLVGAAVVIGDVIALVSSLLGGELTIRFVLKALTIASIAGGIFWHYLRELRSDEQEVRS